MDQMGRGERLPERLAPWLEAKLPNLKSYDVTSPYNGNNNCFAYAVGDETRWWDSGSFPGCYWPPGAKRGSHISALQSAYETEGFQICSDGALEVGYQKVVLYTSSDGEFLHAAKQLDDGSWNSKLGRQEDIRHLKAEWLNSEDYGQVACYMKRPIGGYTNPEERKDSETTRK